MIRKLAIMTVFSFVVTMATSQSAHAWRCSYGLFVKGFGLNPSARPEDGFVIIHKGQKFPNEEDAFIYSSRSECREAMKEIKRYLNNLDADEG